ncbi:hypothetical protein D3C81_1593070 [compost metagenome]
MRAVVIQRQRVGDADAGKGQALLLLQERDLVGQAVRQRMRAALQQASVEQRRHVCRADRSVGHAPRFGLHLDQRLQPEHAARAVADDAHRLAAAGGFAFDRAGHFIGAQRQRGRIARHEEGSDGGAHTWTSAVSLAACVSRSDRTSASKRFAST